MHVRLVCFAFKLEANYLFFYKYMKFLEYTFAVSITNVSVSYL